MPRENRYRSTASQRRHRAARGKAASKPGLSFRARVAVVAAAALAGVTMIVLALTRPSAPRSKKLRRLRLARLPNAPTGPERADEASKRGRRSPRRTHPHRRAASPFEAWRKKGYRLYAMAFPRFDMQLFNARVFAGPAKKPKVIGHVRRGTLLPAGPRVHGPGCPGGRWHRIPGGGTICSSIGFDVARRPIRFRGPKQRVPDVRRPVPFRYGKVTRQGAPLLRGRPSTRDVLQMEEAAAGRMDWPKVVQRRMRGIFILAIDRAERIGNTLFYRTVRGQYVLAKDVLIKPEPEMRGERLSGGKGLPLAFVVRGPQPRHRRAGKTLEPAGRLAKHVRFRVRGTAKIGRVSYVKDRRGFLLRRAHVRVARRRARPTEVPAGAKWVHIDLAAQTLVAYEGDRPVYATLVSSGKRGYATRAGLFQIHRKYLSTTMDATDPIDGFYRIEEVPWTMYYWRSYAIHGAFWHDDFGVTRSHGCTNVAPADARWLFYWTDPKVPEGWHARLGAQGTWFYFTR